MANNVVRMQGGMPQVGQRDGNWVWNGSNWVCDPGCDDGSGFPPFGPPVFSGPVNQPPWYPGANGGVSFGATAPANPVRGHLWWNGTTFYLFDGAAWVVIGGAGTGAALGTTPPANPFPGQQWFNGSVLYVWDGNAWVPTSTTKSSVQATAPPAPNPGDLWFDGTVQRIWSGTAWIAVGPGATVGPVPTTTIEFSMTSPTALTLPGASAWGIIPFAATPQFDQLNGWNSTTHQYLPNRPGVYSVTCRGAPASVSGGVAILKNDPGTFTNVATTSDIIIAIAATATGGWITAAGLVQLNGTTDFVRAWAWDSTGSWSATGSSPVWTATALP
jgi:hypothetical protein